MKWLLNLNLFFANFMEVRLKLNKEDVKDISFERVHRVGKPNAS